MMILPRTRATAALSSALVMTVALALPVGPAHAATTISEFAPLPHNYSQPAGVTSGPDGAVWFTELNEQPFTDQVGRIGRLDPTNGTVVEYSLPGSGDEPDGITAGPDGNLWFANGGSRTIGKITTAGQITEYPSGSTLVGAPLDITAGPDNALWFTDGPDRIGRIDPASGAIAEYCIGKCSVGNRAPTAITAGPDGRVWFTEANPAVCSGCPNPDGKAGQGFIGAADMQGNITEYQVPTFDAEPTGIAAGPDGALWFTERKTNQIGRITIAGAITEFTVPTASSSPEAIAAGPDGALWFVEYNANRIGRITTAGAVTEYPIPTNNSVPGWIATGPDCAMYFTEVNGNRLGKATTDAGCLGGGTTAPTDATPTSGSTPDSSSQAPTSPLQRVAAIAGPRSLGSVLVGRGGYVAIPRVRVACTRAASSTCAVDSIVALPGLSRRERGHKDAANVKALVAGRARSSIRPGHKALIRVRLNRSGLRTLRHAERLKATLRITVRVNNVIVTSRSFALFVRLPQR